MSISDLSGLRSDLKEWGAALPQTANISSTQTGQDFLQNLGRKLSNVHVVKSTNRLAYSMYRLWLWLYSVQYMYIICTPFTSFSVSWTYTFRTFLNIKIRSYLLLVDVVGVHNHPLDKYFAIQHRWETKPSDKGTPYDHYTVSTELLHNAGSVAIL